MEDINYYVDEQPQILNSILARRKELSPAILKGIKNAKRILLCASGTSLNAANTAKDFMSKILSIPVFTCPSSYVPAIIEDGTFAILISQGGSSTNTLKAYEKLKDHPVVALTGQKNCHLNDLCFIHADIGCGEEQVGPKTKGYTSTVLVLYLIALEVALDDKTITIKQYDHFINLLATSFEKMKNEIILSRNWFNANVSSFSGIHACSIIGKHQGAAVAAEGALKVIETIYIPTISYEFEEFLHGPTKSICKDMACFYLMPQKKDLDFERINTLADYHRRISNCVYKIGPIISNDKRDISFSFENDDMGFIFWILPFQIIAGTLPVALGLMDKNERFQFLIHLLDVKE